MSRCPWPGPVVPTRQVQLQRAMALCHYTRTEILTHSTRISHIRNSVQPTFHLLRIYSDISHPEFCSADVPPLSGCLTSALVRPTFHPPGYLTSGILSADVPSPRMSHIRNPVRRRSIHLDISHLAPVAGWERRMIQLPRADMSGSFGNAYPECAFDLSAIPTLSSWGLNHQTSRLSLLSA